MRWRESIQQCMVGAMSERLSPNDWVEEGLKALAAEGFTALKADQLAKSLSVSRGSFYWHFADLGAFQKALLTRWRQLATEAVIEEIDRSASRGDRLRALLRRAFKTKVSLEIAVRAWAISEGQARAAVDEVDRRRLAYLEGLLLERGYGAASASARARVLYWSYLGFALSGRRLAAEELDLVVDALAGLADADSRRR